MGRKKRREEPTRLADDYLHARAYSGIETRLNGTAMMVEESSPGRADEFRDALARGQRAAERADDWPGRAAAMAQAWCEVNGGDWRKFLRSFVEAVEEETRDISPEWREKCLASDEREFDG